MTLYALDRLQSELFNCDSQLCLSRGLSNCLLKFEIGCAESPQHLLEAQLQLVLAQQSGNAWFEEQPLG